MKFFNSILFSICEFSRTKIISGITHPDARWANLLPHSGVFFEDDDENDDIFGVGWLDWYLRITQRHSRRIKKQQVGFIAMTNRTDPSRMQKRTFEKSFEIHVKKTNTLSRHRSWGHKFGFNSLELGKNG